MKIPITKPYFDDKEIAAAAKVIESGWVAQGPKVAEFENKFSEYVHSKNSIAVSSGTAALHLALIALGIHEDDEVIVPSFSFIATANAVVYVNVKPVFADIDPATFNIDPKDIAGKINRKTKAIIAVHQVGLPADMNSINTIGRDHGIPVIEDAACALGSQYADRRIGDSDNIACFSFHPRKVITTGEGGMITVNDDETADLLRSLRNHGANQDSEEYARIGFNFRMTDIQAAIGLEQLKKLDFILSRRRQLAQRYSEAFQENENLIPPAEPPDSVPNYQSYILRIKDSSPVNRDRMIELLHEKGIAAKKGIQAIHREKAYVERYGKVSLPETERAADTTAILPLYPQMTDKDIECVIDTVLSGNL
ncbi:DegT/DnrJ/EryC1/StrS family aminotransferase [candidate division KSB1 bacterium]